MSSIKRLYKTNRGFRMKLEENRFNEIVAALRLADKERDWEERRAYPRVPLQKCMAIIPYRAGATGESADVWVRDISMGGIGLVHMKSMEAGEEFLIRLPQLIGHSGTRPKQSPFCGARVSSNRVEIQYGVALAAGINFRLSRGNFSPLYDFFHPGKFSKCIGRSSPGLRSHHETTFKARCRINGV